jgi:murein DD-endopeptidase MepM/ murein hydrolase activator NlpD
MRIVLGRADRSAVLKATLVALLAGASAACSTDSSRFSDNPFTNPFERQTSVQVDRAATGSTPAAGQRPQPVQSQPLPPIARPATPTRAQPIVGSAAGWSAQGGTPVTVGAGEGLDTLSARYGIPASAILAANGLTSAGQVQAGQQLIMPVYSAGRAAAAPSVAAPVTRMAPIAAPPVTPRAPIAIPPVPAAVATPRVPAAAVVPAAVAAPVAAAAMARPSTPRVVAPAPVARPAAVVPAAPVGRIQPASPARPVVVAPAAQPGRIQPAAPRPQQAAAVPAGRVPSPQARLAQKPVNDEAEQAAPVRRAAAPTSPKPAGAQPAAARQQAAQPMPPQPTEQRRPVAEAPAQKPAEAPQTTASLPAERAAASDKPEFRWPARGRVINGFGSRGGNADGIAIALPEGTPVKAAENGVVAYAGEELKGYGKLVLIRHDNGYVTAYAHNGELNVKRGEAVKRGQTIAKSGQTGNVTSPQLHFEVRKGSQPVDPSKYLDN